MPASAASPLDPVIGVDFNRIDTVQKHALGIELDANDGTRRKYIRAGGAIAQYDALTIDHAEGAYDFAPTAATTDEIAGVAPLAIADNSFGWVIVRGKATVKAAATITAGLHLVATAVAGELDDTAASAANALTMAQGLGVTAIADDTPAAGQATVVLT